MMFRLFICLVVSLYVSSAQETGGRTEPLLRGKVEERELQGATCVIERPDGSQARFAEGESYGNLLTSPCGSSAKWPCFCSAMETDKIRCPYCTFYTSDDEFVCAKSGEDVTFVDKFGIHQTCSCEYIGNGQVQTSCHPPTMPDMKFDVPNGRCALSTNQEQCAQLTANMNFDPDCPCPNFCMGQFIGCCKMDEPCSVTCPGGSNADTDIVGGCKIDPFKQPVPGGEYPPAGPPIPPPSAMMTMPPATARDCVLKQHTENCPSLTAAQAPVPGCAPDSCYNYCDDKFHSCCDPSTMECSVSCSGPTQPVITAGCKLGPQ